MSEALERARRICLSLPEATEQVAWGEPTWRVKKKIFAMFAREGTHHTRGAGDSLWCNAPLGVLEILTNSDPEKFFSPPYAGVNGWVGVVIGKVDDGELRELVIQSYCMVAPAKLAALADREGEG